MCPNAGVGVFAGTIVLSFARALVRFLVLGTTRVLVLACHAHATALARLGEGSRCRCSRTRVLRLRLVRAFGGESCPPQNALDRNKFNFELRRLTRQIHSLPW